MCGDITRGLFAVLAAMLMWSSGAAQAFELYKTFQTPEVFLKEVFNGQVPAPKVLELSASDQGKVAQAFKRNFPQQRLRYWQDGDRSVWIFDDIGKEGYVPTTCGFVISNQSVEVAKVLIYRESRGEQVAEPSFLQQLYGAKATPSGLDVEVDNITGATLSVQMMERMAWTAIVFDSLIQ
ncbi:hypothetical protein GCM10027567_08190 [Spongiibacter taiwanensis]